MGGATGGKSFNVGPRAPCVELSLLQLCHRRYYIVTYRPTRNYISQESSSCILQFKESCSVEVLQLLQNIRRSIKTLTNIVDLIATTFNIYVDGKNRY